MWVVLVPWYLPAWSGGREDVEVTTIAPERVITADIVLDSLSRAVDAYGAEWVDPNVNSLRCLYTYNHDGKVCHCIAGWVMGDLGFEVPPSDDIAIASVIRDRGYDFTEEAIYLLQEAQSSQDLGRPWGWVLQEARDTHHLSVEALVEAELDAVYPEEVEGE